MFTVEERNRARQHVLALAEGDPRVVAGAEVGGLALGGGDRWSDLDLTFGVDGPVEPVLADWTRDVARELGAVQLFDLPTDYAIYRVFLLPGCLQVDLSFGQATEFGARGPKFALLFGEAADVPYAPGPDGDELFGYAVHHALRGRFCIERGRLWQAEHWIAAVRDHALELACLNRGLATGNGRGFDDVPSGLVTEDALVGSLDPDELMRALRASLAVLLREGGDRAAAVEPNLRGLVD